MSKTITEWLNTDKEVANVIINKHQDINVDYDDWNNDILEFFSEKVETFGFEVDIDDISYSGFWSQGDGASFTGNIDILKYLTKTRQKTKYRSIIRCIENNKVSDNVNIDRSPSNYVHENTCFVDDIEEYDDITLNCEILLNELQSNMEHKRYELCKELYSTLEDTYNYLTSKDVVIETLTSNEYKFDENGDIV